MLQYDFYSYLGSIWQTAFNSWWTNGCSIWWKNCNLISNDSDLAQVINSCWLMMCMNIIPWNLFSKWHEHSKANNAPHQMSIYSFLKTKDLILQSTFWGMNRLETGLPNDNPGHQIQFSSLLFFFPDSRCGGGVSSYMLWQSVYIKKFLHLILSTVLPKHQCGQVG